MVVKSVFSHLAGSDDTNLDNFTNEQISRFRETAKFITDSFPYQILRHILISAGIERFTENQFEMVRLGIGLYGISISGLPLQNIGTLRSTVSQVKKVKSSETVGYSRKGKISGESEIAIVPLGYADGIDRKLGTKTVLHLYMVTRVPVIGNICMDMLMLDITGLELNPAKS
ncbi:MAG: alanine racemase [Draconibacterium sp.]|nr:alanine racemase [Draconibacterium sp.]